MNSLTVLDKKDIIFSSESVMDDFGRVFFYAGRVFRAINNEKIDECKTLMQSDLFRELSQEGLIPATWIAEYQLEGFDLVLEHEFIYESKPHHWSFSMFKEAALLILKLNRICNKHGFRLKDAHPFNIFFRRNEPVFIDLGSIIRIDNQGWNKSIYTEFIVTFYIQLLVWCKSELFLARRLIEDSIYSALRTIPMTRVLDSRFIKDFHKDLFEYTLFYRGRSLWCSGRRYHLIGYAARVINKTGSFFLGKTVQPFLYSKELKGPEFVEKRIRSLTRPLNNTMWEDYHEGLRSGNKVVSTQRFDRIIQIVKEKAPDISTAIDLAGNQGAFCYALKNAINLDRVLLTDYDENAIDKAYQSFKANEVDIQPYLFNFMLPLREREIGDLKADIAFAMAITHHLVLTQGYSLPAIFSKIGEFSNKYVVIEFMPVGLLGKNNKAPEVPEWYHRNWFRKEFTEQFTLLHEEQLEKNRIVFIGKKKKLDF